MVRPARRKAGVIRPGDVQRMSAGRGVMHSEFNHAPNDTTHFLQIWIEPNVRGIEASYEQKHFDADSKRGTLRLVASPDGRDGSVTLHADASIYAGLLDGPQVLKRELDPKRRAYLHVVRGEVEANARPCTPGMRSVSNKKRNWTSADRSMPRCCCSI